MPANATVIAAWSVGVPRRTAAMIPSGSATRRATLIAASASSIVAGTRSQIAATTG